MDSSKKTFICITFLLWLFFCGLSQADEGDLALSTFLEKVVFEAGSGIAVQGCGNNTYVIGYTKSSDFPITAGVFDSSHNGNVDIFVSKLNTTGSTLCYSTFLGGSGWDSPSGIVLDGSDNFYVTGTTTSGNFPTTTGSFDSTFNGGSFDAFVFKLDASGRDLIFSTFIGGSRADYGNDIAADDSGNVYLTGKTWSEDFPTTQAAFDTTYDGGYEDVFVAKLNSVGSTLEYGTFLGGDNEDEGCGIVMDCSGNAYVTGYTSSANFPTTAGAFDTSYNGSSDVFVIKLNSTSNSLKYATFLGGSSRDNGLDITKDRFGNAYVTGFTESSDFPTTSGTFDATFNGGVSDVFVAKLTVMGSSLGYSTFLGGIQGEHANGIAVDNSGNAYVTGRFKGTGFPTTPGAFDTTHNGWWDVFVVKLNPTGDTLSYSTYLGGSAEDLGNDIAVDCAGNAYVTGETYSFNFPTTAGAFDTEYDYDWDCFVTKLNPAGKALSYSTFLGGTFCVPIEEETPLAELPKTFILHQNYPNPFNSSTEIRYQLSVDSYVTLKIFNPMGQKVRTLVDSEQKAGEYGVLWDGRDARGQKVASGLYFCRLEAGEFGKTIKMVLLK